MGRYKVYVNYLTMAGAVTKDPEFKATANSSLLKFDLGWSNKAKTTTGKEYQRKHYQTCQLWGKMAEMAAKHIKKGCNVFVMGSLITNQWMSPAGRKMYKAILDVTSWSVLDAPDQSDKPEDPNDPPSDQEVQESTEDFSF